MSKKNKKKDRKSNTKAGDYVYNNHSAKSRGELEELLACCLLEVCQDTGSKRLSNGGSADAMFAALDFVVFTEEQWEKIERIMKGG